MAVTNPKPEEFGQLEVLPIKVKTNQDSCRFQLPWTRNNAKGWVDLDFIMIPSHVLTWIDNQPANQFNNHVAKYQKGDGQYNWYKTYGLDLRDGRVMIVLMEKTFIIRPILGNFHEEEFVVV